MNDTSKPDSQKKEAVENQAKQWQQDMFNVPNQISFARILLAFILFALIGFKFYWAAFVVFVIAAGTDWVDGWYARKYDQVTQIGRNLDSFCDKILICGAFIMLAVEMNSRFPWHSKIAGWMAVVVVARELLVTVIRSMIEASGGDFSAKMAGKLKMWFQCVAVGSSLVALAMARSSQVSPPEIPDWVWWTMATSIWLAVLSTLYSGWIYIKAAKAVLSK